MMQSESPLRFEILDRHIAVVTIDRPHVRNAIDADIASRLEAAVRRIEADKNLRVAIISGAGEHAFSAGADLKEIAAGRADTLVTEDGGFAGFVFAHRTKPWIAAVGGAALGGGMEIALACDLIVASENASFGLPEVRRGLVAAGGGAYRVTRVLPRAIALEMLTTGVLISAQQAHSYGMVNRLTPAGKHLAAAIALARQIAAAAPGAVRESLKIGRASSDQDEAGLRALSAKALRAVRDLKDYREGVQAFVDKRLPEWRDE